MLRDQLILDLYGETTNKNLILISLILHIAYKKQMTSILHIITGNIALKRCVINEAPLFTASSPSCKFPMECPKIFK